MLEAAIDAWLKRGSVCFKPASRTMFADVAARKLVGIDDRREAAMFDGATADMWHALTSIAQLGRVSPTLRRGLAGYRTLHSALLRQVQARREMGKAATSSATSVRPASPQGLLARR